MTAQLIIRFHPAQWPLVEWAYLTANGELNVAPQPTTLQEIPAPAETDTVNVLVPGVDVLTTRVKIPYTTRAQLRKAVPFALEDQLVADVETQHFALGKMNPDDSITVAIVAKQKMHEWLITLQKAGIHPTRLLPDYLTLPLKATAWTIGLETEQALIRTGKETGYALAAEHLPLFLSSLLTKAKVSLPEQLLVKHFPNAPTLEWPPLTVALQSETLAEPLLATAARVLQHSSPTLNLLQGEFQIDYKYVRFRRWWRAAALVGSAWLIVLVLGHGVAYFYLKNQQQTLQNQSNTLLQPLVALGHGIGYFYPKNQQQASQTQTNALPQPLLPKTATAQDLRFSISQELAELQTIATAPSFINLLAKVGSALPQAAKWRLLALDYDKPRLTLQIQADTKTLQSLLTAYARQGLTVTSEKMAKPPSVKLVIQAGKRP